MNVPKILDRFTRTGVGLVQAAAVAFAVLPPLVVIAFSFSGEKFLSFPPHKWGTDQYTNLAHSAMWRDAILTSFKVGVPVALVTMAIVAPAAFAITTKSFKGGSFLEFASLAPLLIPMSAYSIALYVVYVNVGLIGTYLGLVLAQATIAIPVSLLITTAALRRIPRDLEFAAMSLGASRARATIGITGRLLMPALATGFIFAFLTSFDDAVLVTFLGGGQFQTLSAAIFQSLRNNVDPVVTAISTLLMVFTALLLTVSMRGRSGGKNK